MRLNQTGDAQDNMRLGRSKVGHPLAPVDRPVPQENNITAHSPKLHQTENLPGAFNMLFSHLLMILASFSATDTNITGQ